MAVSEKANSTFQRLIRVLLRKQAAGRKKSSFLAPVPVPESDSSERRSGQRRTYSQLQFLASFDGRRSPHQSDFRLVMCHDLSPRGFSYFCERAPRHRRLIIALGKAPFTFFEAEIVRRESALSEREPGWLLGCKFLRQLIGTEIN